MVGPPGDGGHAGDARLAEQPLVLLELAVPLVGADARLGGRQVPVPPTDDVPGGRRGEGEGGGVVRLGWLDLGF